MKGYQPTITAAQSGAYETCFEASETVINGLIKDYERLPQGPTLVNIIARYSTLVYTVLDIMVILFIADNYSLRLNGF
jgi:hypothetical protein